MRTLRNHLEEDKKAGCSYRCIVTKNVLWLFLAVSLVGLQCVIVVFPDHTHLISNCCIKISYTTFRSILSALFHMQIDMFQLNMA